MSEATRLTELEERYAHLQRHVAEQDKAMLAFSEDLIRLRKEITLLRAQHPRTTPETGDADDERPPHY